MYKPDEDIDRLSREAAEHYNAPGKPAWDALRETLNKELPQEERKRRGFLFFFLLAVGVSVAGGTIWYTVRFDTPVIATEKPVTKQPGQRDNSTAAAKMLPVKVKDKVLSATTGSNNNKRVNTQKASSGSPVTKAAGVAMRSNSNEVKSNHTISLQAASMHRPYKTPQPPLAALPERLPRNANRQEAVSSTTKKINYKDRNREPAAQDNSMQDNHTGADIAADDIKKDIPIRELPPMDLEHNTPPANTRSNPAVQLLVSPAPAVADTKQVVPVKNSGVAHPKASNLKNKPAHQQAILMGLTAGLDMSTVKFRYGSNAGYDIGFLGGYQFSSHWSAYTGISYTKKKYKLKGSDYNPPRNYWTQYVQLETIEGYCRMWELPLLARYTFNPGAKTAFFVSMGMSSYFMKRQVYDYYYKTSTGPANTIWTNDNTFNHIFNILDLSAGIEKRVGKHISWQIEPYARIPLGGVGFGNIRLSSFGINFTVQYKQPIKR
ncbi:MAG: porin family protein [Bacteroidota bacterium]